MIKELKDEARRWGFRTQTGVRGMAPMRARGLRARHKIDEGGHQLMLRRRVEIVRHKGTTQKLTVGDGVQLAEFARLVFEGPTGHIEIGDDVFINARSEIRARKHVKIGSHSILAFDVVVMDTNHHDIDGVLTTAPVIIGERVWVGARAMILRGVTVGDGAVVAAGSIVSRDVPPGSLVAGIPAAVIRENVVWHR